MTYEEAVSQAATGKGLILSNAGGWKRYGMFTLQSDGSVIVRLFQTIIAIFTPTHVSFNRGMWDTATTRETINCLLPSGLRGFATSSVWSIYGHDNSVVFVNGMSFRYDGTVADVEPIPEYYFYPTSYEKA